MVVYLLVTRYTRYLRYLVPILPSPLCQKLIHIRLHIQSKAHGTDIDTLNLFLALRVLPSLGIRKHINIATFTKSPDTFGIGETSVFKSLSQDSGDDIHLPGFDFSVAWGNRCFKPGLIGCDPINKKMLGSLDNIFLFKRLDVLQHCGSKGDGFCKSILYGHIPQTDRSIAVS